MSFGAILQEIRLAKGKTQRQVADAAEMDYGYYSRLENEKIPSRPTKSTVEKLSRSLECSQEEARRLLAAAGRLDDKVEEVARLATSERPDLGELFLAAANHPPATIEKIIRELRTELENDRNDNS
jgi:transcriptional regulator with XRE-family HTH domain